MILFVAVVLILFLNSLQSERKEKKRKFCNSRLVVPRTTWKTILILFDAPRDDGGKAKIGFSINVTGIEHQLLIDH